MTLITSFSGEHRFLSNFYPSIIPFEGITFATVEHAYQAAKTLDFDARLRIAALATPGEAKKAGRELVLRPGWEAVKVDVMRRLLKRKFRHPELARLLLATGDEPLVEGNHWNDTFWGVCNGVGANHLGRLLMEVRRKLRYPDETGPKHCDHSWDGERCMHCGVCASCGVSDKDLEELKKIVVTLDALLEGALGDQLTGHQMAKLGLYDLQNRCHELRQRVGF